MKYHIYPFILIGFFVHQLFSQVTVLEDSIFSQNLRAYSKFTVLLPDSYSTRNDRNPVLYLLHGLYGDNTNWVKLTDLVRYADQYKFIIIIPDGKNSWFSDSPVDTAAQYEHFIIKDLIPFAEQKYMRTINRSERAIAGLSMGGYGAFKFGLKYPSLFFFAAGMSPAIQFPAGLEDTALVARRSKTFIQSVYDAFGPTRRASWDDNDVFSIARQASDSLMPYFYLSVGSQDAIPEIVELTHSFAATLRSRKIPFEMHETAGGHNWKFWNKEIEIVLKRMSELYGGFTKE